MITKSFRADAKSGQDAQNHINAQSDIELVSFVTRCLNLETRKFTMTNGVLVKLQILVFIVIGVAWSLSLYPASCPEPRVMENFDIERVRIFFIGF